MKKRSVVIAGHKTSVSLELAFWIGLKDAATARDTSVAKLDTAPATGAFAEFERTMIRQRVKAGSV